MISHTFIMMKTITTDTLYFVGGGRGRSAEGLHGYRPIWSPLESRHSKYFSNINGPEGLLKRTPADQVKPSEVSYENHVS